MSACSSSVRKMSSTSNSSAPYKNFFSRKFVGRQCKQTEGLGRLEASSELDKKDLSNLRHTRYRLVRHKPVSSSSSLFHLAPGGSVCQRNRCSGSGSRLEPIQPSLCFPSIQSHSNGPTESNSSESGQDDISLSVLAIQDLFHNFEKSCNDYVSAAFSEQHGHGPTDGVTSSKSSENETCRLSHFWKSYDRGGGESNVLKPEARELVAASWRSGTEKEYTYQWRKWQSYCRKHSVQPLTPSIEQIVNFLTSLYKQGLQWSTINTARSALSSTIPPINGVPVGQHYMVSRLLKGIYNKKPRTLKLYPKWDVSVALETVKSWGPNNKLDLKLLTYKAVFLLALVCSKRPSSLALLSVHPTVFQATPELLRLYPVGIEKHSRPNYVQQPIHVHRYTEDSLLDPISCIMDYTDRVQSIRASNSLFVTVTSPHKGASSSSISRWISSVISLSGQTGSGGSTRSVSTSTAFSRGVPLDAILQAGDWSRAATFQRFYLTPMQQPVFSNSVLSANV